ncbi:hypothetical protein [Paraburkholderia oxyphila]|uniref:hypothetical protein n=1 Tax=Paraburkholderia oxyphila TaxID=614212 RepID=UPI0012EE9E25|nr:hypothetical protein [Paraburkholderia oxyphila]
MGDFENESDLISRNMGVSIVAISLQFRFGNRDKFALGPRRGPSRGTRRFISHVRRQAPRILNFFELFSLFVL